MQEKEKEREGREKLGRIDKVLHSGKVVFVHVCTCTCVDVC